MQSKFKTGAPTGESIDLEGCLVQVAASKAWFARRVLPLSLEQLRWRPEPHRWSIAECLDHLNITLALYLPKIDHAIGFGRGVGRVLDQFSPGPELEALRLVEPPVWVRTLAPPAILPAAAVDPDRLVEQFHCTRDRYAETVGRAFRLDLSGIVIAEPLYPRISSVRGTLALLAAHDRRHIWQAEQIRNGSRFPRALFSTRREEVGVLVEDERQGMP